MTPSPDSPSFEYHRPASLADALALLGRSQPLTRPLAGGTRLAPGAQRPAAVVDLAALALAGVTRHDPVWRIGATTTLATLAAATELPAGLRRAAERHAAPNIRQRATVGGAVASRSSGPLLAALLALAARVVSEPDSARRPLADYLSEPPPFGHLIVAIEIPVARDCALSEISRSPADAPGLVVAVGVERTPAGPRAFSVAAAGAAQPTFRLPAVAQLLESAPDSTTAALAASLPDLPWLSDPRGSREYRAAMTPLLVQRAVAQLLAEEAPHAG